MENDVINPRFKHVYTAVLMFLAVFMAGIVSVKASAANATTIYSTHNEQLSSALTHTTWTTVSGKHVDEKTGLWMKRIGNASGTPVFCTELGVLLNGGGIEYGGSWYDYNAMTTNTAIMKKVSAIGYYGYFSQPTMANYAKTQFLIWETQGNKLLTMTGTSDYQTWKKNVLANVAKLDTTPSFNKKSYNVNVGKSITLTDTNKSLSTYESNPKSNSTGATFVIKGNSLVITAKSGSKSGTVNYNKSIPKTYQGTPVLYQSAGSQSVVKIAIDPLRGGFAVGLKVNDLGKLRITKSDAETGSTPQGQASLIGAQYALKPTDDSKTLETLTIGSDLKAITTGSYAFGNYHLVETKAPVGYALDPTVRTVNIAPNTATSTTNITDVKVTDDVIRGNVKIEKFAHANSNETGELQPLAGAEFAIYKNYGDKALVEKVTADSKGHVAFNNMAYGWYVVKEEKAPEGYVKVQDWLVEINEKGKTLYYHKVDEHFRSKVRLVKKDKETGSVVALAGTKFKIKDLATGEYVSMTENNITEFTTDKTGTVMLPEQLAYGNYALVEMTAPAGYILNKDEVKFKVSPESAVDGVVIVELSDIQQYGQITINKVTAHLSGAIKNETAFGTQYQLTYKDGALQGVEFDVIASEDIYSANGVLMTKKGEVVDHLVTDEKGSVSSIKLGMGKYHLVETKAPAGAVLLDKQVDFELTYAGQDIDLSSKILAIVNQQQSVKVKINKVEETITGYKGFKPQISTVVSNGKTFGLFTKAAIIVNDEVIVPANGMLSQAVTKNGIAGFDSTNLPSGTYYVKELDAGKDHILDTNKYEFTYDVANNDAEYEVDLRKNDPIVNKLYFSKVTVSKTDITGKKELAGSKLTITGDHNTNISWTSDGHAKEIELANGHYTLHEVAAPNGYLIASDIEFDVKDGKALHVTMIDEAKKVLSQTDHHLNVLWLVLGSSIILIALAAAITIFADKNKKSDEK